MLTHLNFKYFMHPHFQNPNVLPGNKNVRWCLNLKACACALCGAWSKDLTSFAQWAAKTLKSLTQQHTRQVGRLDFYTHKTHNTVGW